ncbi:FKBP-type peptidyl-prolyl cis-trans isomerase [Microbacterium halophytorum]|uniref:FKBP-type peptidyl-prolyl cis-trans isomerase n=1 Tax=Microbacterium halophytorum TaxID=2067568 RepID=UPI00131A3E97|nr:FKBP-type peptidyl-prolyl cis-trans isomerase [Microbacterium halophytorum]
MRFRSAALMSTAVIAVLALSGCAGGDESGEPDAAADPLCAAAGPSGEAVESLDISGAAGDEVPDSLDIADPIDPEEFERAVVTEGDGAELAEGDFVTYALAGYDAETGEQLGKAGYEPGEMQPAQLSAQSAVGQVFGCATVGSRIATVYPAVTAEDGTETPAQIQIVDVISTPEKTAWGEDQEPVDGMPTVTLADDGEPTIEIPDGMEIPEETETAVLKQGDGAEVTADDTVYVQYKGVKASDGEEFDSSWSRGMVATFPVSGVVEGFQKALIGQKVGSQVVAVLPRTEAYHVEGNEDNELYDEDLIFVVDIVDVFHPAEQAAE